MPVDAVYPRPFAARSAAGVGLWGGVSPPQEKDGAHRVARRAIIPWRKHSALAMTAVTSIIVPDPVRGAFSTDR